MSCKLVDHFKNNTNLAVLDNYIVDNKVDENKILRHMRIQQDNEDYVVKILFLLDKLVTKYNEEDNSFDIRIMCDNCGNFNLYIDNIIEIYKIKLKYIRDNKNPCSMAMHNMYLQIHHPLIYYIIRHGEFPPNDLFKEDELFTATINALNKINESISCYCTTCYIISQEYKKVLNCISNY